MELGKFYSIHLDKSNKFKIDYVKELDDLSVVNRYLGTFSLLQKFYEIDSDPFIHVNQIVDRLHKTKKQKNPFFRNKTAVKVWLINKNVNEAFNQQFAGKILEAF